MVGSRRTTGRSQSAERILDEERAFTRAELVIIIIMVIMMIMISDYSGVNRRDT